MKKGYIASHRARWHSVDLDRYSDEFAAARRATESLLSVTRDLELLRKAALAIVANADSLVVLRYLAGPPISEDDLKVLADTNTLNATRVSKEPWRAKEAVETILLGLDANRFPWVGESRKPTASERDAAVVATATLIAQRRTMTSRAHESKQEQEDAVAAALVSVGFRQVPNREIPTFSQAPSPGTFCRESIVGGRKADIVARLLDGRLMPIECKVSNSSTNSVKRLNNDAAVKAKTWLEEFGSSQTVPTAVLGGVFNVRNLEDAQARGLTIFWAHDLSRLEDFVTAATS